MDTRRDSSTAILFFGNDWFAENRTSSHHIAAWLAERHRVYYIECPGLRAPKGSGRDIKKIFVKIARFFEGARPVRDGLWVRTLFQVPLHRYAVVRWLNRMLITATLRWLKWREGIRRPIAWFMVPHLASVAGTLEERLTVYYCIDDYAALPGVNAQAIGAMDREMTRRADLVFVASDTLVEGKKQLNSNTHLSPHGVDLEHFAKAQSAELAIPDDVRDLPRPIVGFFGLIERWIDLDLIDYLATQRPGWSFVLIGHVAVPDDEVPRRPNLHYLGKRPYQTLAAYGKSFDAAIIPYRLTQQVLHANPIKLREYLALGKPTVSVSTPEIDKYADVVDIASTREVFLEKLDAALENAASAEAIQRRMGRVAREGWNARLEQVMSLLDRHLSVDDEDPLLTEKTKIETVVESLSHEK